MVKSLRVGMKITRAFCDIHADLELELGVIETRSAMGDLNTFHTARCSNPMCLRVYTRDDGYFDAQVGKPFNFGDMGRKPRCGWNHHVEYMVLTKLDGVLTWACQVERCRAIKPYGAVSPFTLHPTGRAGDGPNIDNWNDIFQYVVRHLPAGEEAWIARERGKWMTLRCTNGVQGQWSGECDDPKEALESLTAMFKSSLAV
jgi:hypothetical protein